MRTSRQLYLAWAAAFVALAVVLGLVAWFVPRVTLPSGDIPETGARGQPLVSAYGGIVQDQGNTVPLPDGRILWIFADTVQRDRDPRFFVTSSAAVSEPDSLFLRYLTDDRGAPAEFMPRTPAEKAATDGTGYTAVWPTGATLLEDGRILIAYTKYRVSKDQTQYTFLGGGLYAYEYQGRRMVGAAPAERIAELWTPADGAVASPIRAGRYVYFTQCEWDQHTCYSLRAPADQVTDRNAYRWWTGAVWTDDRERRQPMIYGGDHPGRNPAVGYLADAHVYVAVDTSWGIQSTSGRVWVAPRPWGPWSAAAKFTLPRCVSGEGCYTLNPHPAMSTSRMLRVSYATAHDGPHVYVVDVPIELGAAGRWVKVREDDP
jgi:hypothetical protein